MTNRAMRNKFQDEKGAALAAVILITFLLLAACIAMIKAASANSVNTSDVLADTKAFYAAESGIAAAVHILRNQNVNYKDAVNQDNGTLVDWRATNWNAPNGTAGYSLGTETTNGYTLKVSDPDNSQTHVDFRTDTDGSTLTSGFSANGSTFSPTLKIPANDAVNYYLIEWISVNPAATAFNGDPNVVALIGQFKLTRFGSPATFSKTWFRINLRFDIPDTPTWVISGTIDTAGLFTFNSAAYRMIGSDIWLCNSTGSCPASAPSKPTKTFGPFPLTPNPKILDLAAKFTPLEPQRLLIKSIGYGPNNSRKSLEAIVKKSFFPLVPPVSGVVMLGANAAFNNGNGRPVYNGCDPANPDVCVPSFGVTDVASLTNINGANYNSPQDCPTCPNPYPAPAIAGEDLPDWQKTPLGMDQMINLWRSATPVGSLKTVNSNLNTGDYGNYAAGTGLTFCEQDCTIQGEGGGILIVKGRLTTQGGVRFKGYMIVVGADGILRNGNGGSDDEILGGIIIAPYTLSPSPGAWLQPRFNINGGGTSRITYSGMEFMFNGGISGTTNFVAGVAEK